MTPATTTPASAVRTRRRQSISRDDLTLRRLEVLVRLHRRDIEGAGAELIDALDTRRDELASSLGLTSVDLPLPGGAEQLPSIVALIEARVSSMRGDASEARGAEAARLASRIAEEAIHGFDGIELDLPLLVALVAVPGFDVVAFKLGDELLGVGRLFVAALLREIGTVRLTSLRVVHEECALRVTYEGAHAHGWFRLRLEAPNARRACVVVDLESVRAGKSADEPPCGPTGAGIGPESCGNPSRASGASL